MIQQTQQQSTDRCSYVIELGISICDRAPHSICLIILRQYPFYEESHSLFTIGRIFIRRVFVRFRNCIINNKLFD